MRSPLTEKFQRVTSLIDEVNALPEDERGLFLDLLQPETEEPVKQKKTRKKRASKQRVGMPPTMATEAAKPGDETASADHCRACGNDADFQDHFKPSPVFHEFQSSKTKKAAASGD